MERDYREVVQSWLDGNFDEATKAQIRVLSETDPVALEDAFYRNLEFGTGGLRGIMGVGTNRMNKYTVGMATQGLANYMKENCEGPLSVCISFDSRNNSPEFAQITANVLAANGIHVYIFDKLHPIALMSYSVRSKKATAGIMITASHNPKEYNGYKVFWSDGAQVTSPVDKDIVAESLRLCNVFKVNDEELAVVKDMFGYEGMDDHEVCRRLISEWNLKFLILTCGVNGSYVFTENEKSFMATPVVDVADTVGAGDSFISAFMASILKGESIQDAHRMAVEVSAYVCTQYGAMLELPAEILNSKD